MKTTYRGLKVLSLFDGISCGRVALERAGIKIDRYVAFEIDKYAISVSKFNHPDIEHRGSVAGADFSEFEGFDMVIGGFPCTDLSLAKKNRQGLKGDKSSLFWELVRAIKEVKPKYFMVENNYGMPEDDFITISRTLGVEPILINSALVSAQQRRRFYWTNIGMIQGGLFDDWICGISQPLDKGILLKDVLESGVWQDKKAHTLTSRYSGAQLHNTLNHHKNTMIAEPIKVCNVNPSGNGMNGNVYSSESKSPTLTTNKGEGIKIIEPVGAALRSWPRSTTEGRFKRLEIRSDSKSNALTSVQADSMCCESICLNPLNSDGIQPSQSDRIYSIDGKLPSITSGFHPKVAIATPVQLGNLHENGSQSGRIYSVKGKSVAINSGGGGAGAKTGLYKIDLPDGDYLIRKLTPIECERLQTLPDNYTAKGIDEKGNIVDVSNSQRYKQLGNGWTVDVIVHILKSIP